MIQARHELLPNLFFSWYVPYILRKHFSRIILHGVPRRVDESILVLANHTGWWDPFVLYYANKKLFRKKYHVMMLEEELRKRPLLARAGCYSVKKNSKSVVESLDYTCRLLEKENNLVLLFPQGKIESALIGQVTFAKGIEFVLSRLNKRTSVLFAALFIEYFSDRKPEAHFFYDWATVDVTDKVHLAESLFNKFYSASRYAVIKLHV